MFNLELDGRITLRSSLAHGAFQQGGTVTAFRREPVIQRHPDGTLQTDPYAVVVDDPLQRETLRQYAQRLLRIIWQSKDDRHRWTYANLAERAGVVARMTATLPDFTAELINQMSGTHPILFGDDAEYLDKILSAGDSGTLLALLRESGERLLIVTRMQAESAARYEGRPLPENGHLLPNEELPADVPALKPQSKPFIPFVPVYSGNALRNGAVRRGAARFLLDRYAWRVPVDEFRALFSGGSLVRTGEKGLNLSTRKAMLELMPLYALLGGPFNRSDMVEGSCKPSKAWPIVREAAPVLPAMLREEAAALQMAEIVAVESNARRDDAKLLAAQYLNQPAVIGGSGEGAVAGSSMFMEAEVLIPGTQLWSRWNFYQTTPLQVGAWISGWIGWSQRDHLGGKAQWGFGRADVEYYCGGDLFLAVRDGDVELSDAAQEYLDGYTRHLDTHVEAIRDFLKATPDLHAVPTEIDLTALQADLEKEELDE